MLRGDKGQWSVAAGWRGRGVQKQTPKQQWEEVDKERERAVSESTNALKRIRRTAARETIKDGESQLVRALLVSCIIVY